MASDSTSTANPSSSAAAAVAMSQLLVMKPTIVIVSTPCSASQAATSVPANTLALSLVTRFYAGATRLATSGWSCQLAEPSAKTGAPSGSWCWTTTTGRSPAAATSMARVTLFSERLSPGVLDLKDAVEVLLLDVDDDEGAAGGGHGWSSPGGWRPAGRRLSSGVAARGGSVSGTKTTFDEIGTACASPCTPSTA